MAKRVEINAAIDAFLGDYSENTARTYRNGLNRFLAWSSIENIADLDPKRIMPFVRFLKAEGLSPRSIATYATAVIRLLHWLKREGVAPISGDEMMILQEQMKDWNRKNQATPLPRLPEETAVQATIQAAHQASVNDNERVRLYHLRNTALMETLASTGCRISEAANLRREDLVGEQMAAWVRSGKGRRDRLIVFDSEGAWSAIQSYFEERDKLGFTVDGKEPVFSRHDKIAHGRGILAPLTTTSMRIAISSLMQGAHFTPHQLRHRAATGLLRRTGNLPMVQRYLGHADIGTTANTYLHLSNQDLIEAVRGG